MLIGVGLGKRKLQPRGDFRRKEALANLVLSGMSLPSHVFALSQIRIQIYIDKNRDLSIEILKKVERLGAKAIIFTVDVGWWSKRTLESRLNGTLPKSSLGAFMASGGQQDRNLCWNDISWIRVSAISPF